MAKTCNLCCLETRNKNTSKVEDHFIVYKPYDLRVTRGGDRGEFKGNFDRIAVSTPGPIVTTSQLQQFFQAYSSLNGVKSLHIVVALIQVFHCPQQHIYHLCYVWLSPWNN